MLQNTGCPTDRSACIKTRITKNHASPSRQNRCIDRRMQATIPCNLSIIKGSVILSAVRRSRK
jgi:hypothetical protein